MKQNTDGSGAGKSPWERLSYPSAAAASVPPPEQKKKLRLGDALASDPLLQRQTRIEQEKRELEQEVRVLRKLVVTSNPRAKPVRRVVGQAFCRGRVNAPSDFDYISVGGVRFDLTGRKVTRLCIQCLVDNKAFSRRRAISLAAIDDFVAMRLGVKSHTTARIWDYFADSAKIKLRPLKKLVIGAGVANGTFFLQCD